MDESDLRVGGWKKPRRITLPRLQGLLLVLALGQWQATQVMAVLCALAVLPSLWAWKQR